MIIVTEEQTSLFDLWMNYPFQTRTLSLLSDVSMQTIDEMIVGLPVGRNDAKKVLDKLSKLIHKECTLKTVHVSLLEEEGNEDATTE
jgi:hypothetical protein